MSAPRRFRKKPVEVEAMGPLSHDNAAGIAAWCRGRVNLNAELLVRGAVGSRPWRADVGDWIIRGVHGEFYPCKPEIFDATYEPVEAEA